jgi:hypothetical protein
MALHVLLRRFLIVTLLVNNVDGWSWPSKASFVRSFPKGQTPIASSSTFLLLSLYGLLSFPSLVSADATTITPSTPVITQEQLMQSLTPPTDERPQIIPPTRNNLQLQDSAVMEGMVYLLDTNDRPETSDLIVITMTTIDDPNTVLAGAKYPVSRARIPFNFQFKDANIIKGKEEFFRASMDKDLIIQVKICPETASSIPCLEEESTFLARGISKLVKIPGMKENEQVIVRTAAALPLSRTVIQE